MRHPHCRPAWYRQGGCQVYKRKLEPTKDFIAFSAFVNFFPQVVAGPIERATHLLPQFQTNRIFNYTKAVADEQLELGVREPAMPAGIATLVIQLIIDIPTENAVAKATALLQQVHEFAETHVLPANHAIDVGQTQFDPANPTSLILRHLFIEQLVGATHPPPRLFTCRMDFTSARGLVDKSV